MVEKAADAASKNLPENAEYDPSIPVAAMVESIIGCKWSLQVLEKVRAGIKRPGELQRACDGISTKVLNERLNKMLRFGIFTRTVFAEVPPRVEYAYTLFGEKFLGVVDEVAKLQREMEED